MNDKEMLKAAARAAGHKIFEMGGVFMRKLDGGHVTGWNPLNDDADALRLAATRLVDVEFTHKAAGAGDFCYVERYEDHGGDRLKAARRAIVRCVVARKDAS